MKRSFGIYLHIPFCSRKCPYCDFYSVRGSEQAYDRYVEQLSDSIRQWGEQLRRGGDTLYFGGGTPGLIGAERLIRLAEVARQAFHSDFEEITAEVNPTGQAMDFQKLRQGGFQRISIGVQSANEDELDFLGRSHCKEDTVRCIQSAKAAGFENISMDLMIALPGQTKEKLRRSVDFCVAQGASHISAYILKVEPGTLFARRGVQELLPDEDESGELYECLCQRMREHGFRHYEISNFALPGMESRHNLKYWHTEEYLGLGPSAHSFVDGKRFYYPRNAQKLSPQEVIPDGDGGEREEYLMLGLRLSEGITEAGWYQRYGEPLPIIYRQRAEQLTGYGLTSVSDTGFAITEKGFPVSNSIILKIIQG